MTKVSMWEAAHIRTTDDSAIDSDKVKQGMGPAHRLAGPEPR